MITIDLSYFDKLAAMSPLAIMWRLFADGGWIIILWVFLWGSWEIWVNWRQNLYEAKRRWIFLAIDIPKAVLDDPGQSPRAVENIFAHLDGAHGSDTLWESYWEGKTQDWFSLEIVSTEGYIQFVIRTRDKFRDLVEAAIYAQYPDAEITEVIDYTKWAPGRFPDPEWELFGTEWTKVRQEDAYPLRTYHDFEDPTTKEFKDPLAAMLETMSKIGKGEHIWFQILVTPISQKEWTTKGVNLVKKLIGAKVESKQTWTDKAFDLPLKVADTALSQILSSGEEAPKKKEEKKEASQMQYLSPGTKTLVEAIERKISKIGFQTKIRMIYIARKEVFKKTRAAHPMVGAIKQFSALDGQSIKPEYKKVGTAAHYILVNKRVSWKKEKIMRAYRGRSTSRGIGKGFVLNVEELATMWHFPATWIKAPAVKAVESKRGVPPVNLPFEQPSHMKPIAGTEGEKELTKEIPPNLPME
ncbi:MAG: hypothetical protein ACOZAG_00875 [Patescibacteria group bacterium]